MDGRTEDWRIDGEVAVTESKEYFLHSSKNEQIISKTEGRKGNIINLCGAKEEQTVKTKSHQHVTPWTVT